ncbi:pyrroloquinoline quinone biosynthesis protein PqqE [Poseidonocella sp. HB161398]|uniref:pyrroloquinoline quinone biosynthesis protein PqqE n=1 Tax=Poseidonocella sp. HB161398 TaxID=2320855 RepID=UPI001107D5B6|nr:pyrroloquinoline quinone biosynthesis protein PqqE [Poseidonocella sp. HB161398]
MTQPPIAMLAELTHRCPLACPYCSNPLDLTRREAELDTATWARVFREAAALGVLQLHLSGGEPLARRDLAELVKAAREAGLYANLITSGIGLTDARAAELEAAGLDHVQLSLQGTDAAMADEIGGYQGGFARKMAAAEIIRATGFPLTLNFVMHRRNMHQLPRALEMAVEMGARRIEVATVQVHGWAERNRGALVPTRAQAAEATAVVGAARARLKGVLVIDYVPADYHSAYPKACMGGWGSTGLNVTPAGRVLPCHAAETIPHLEFQSVQTHGLAEIWTDGPAFNAYRGTEWMQEPCTSCERKSRDFGGCRCQAMALAGDAAATDPVCSKSPRHAELAAQAERWSQADDAMVYRPAPGKPALERA